MTDTATNTASISANATGVANNAAAIAALQVQVGGAPAAPDLSPYALASDLAAAEGLIAANTSGITALNTSLAAGLAGKANQSALDALQLEVNGKSTPASVDVKLQAYSTTAAMNSAIASANNATLASVANTYALRTACRPRSFSSCTAPVVSRSDVLAIKQERGLFLSSNFYSSENLTRRPVQLEN